jgi:hypothetical protein
MPSRVFVEIGLGSGDMAFTEEITLKLDLYS